MNARSSLFGYGSLINKASFERTLGHKLSDDKFRIVRLNGYLRSWTLCHSIEMYPENKRALLPPNKRYIVYLDVTPVVGASIIGSLVQVTPGELARFDRRERNYHRINITADLSYVHPGTQGYVYVGNEDSKTDAVPKDECVIIKEYVDLIKAALHDFEPSVVDEYWDATMKTSIDIMSFPGFYGN